LLIISLLAQDYLTVGSCPNDLHQVEIVNAQTAFSNLYSKINVKLEIERRDL
jgi:hypothetical protein